MNSLLHRARFNLRKHYPSHRQDLLPSKSIDQATKTLLDRYVRAWELANVDEIIGLLREELTFAMPPFPLWIQGRPAIKAFISVAILNGDARGRWRLLPIRANGGAGFAWYQKDGPDKSYKAFAIQVLTVGEGGIGDITTFVEPTLFPIFNLPDELANGT